MHTNPTRRRYADRQREFSQLATTLPSSWSKLIALAAFAVANPAFAQSAAPATQPVSPLLYPYAISAVDVDAATVADQPNVHGIAVTTGPDGQPHLFCLEPSQTQEPGRLQRELQTGADSVRYQ